MLERISEALFTAESFDASLTSDALAKSALTLDVAVVDDGF